MDNSFKYFVKLTIAYQENGEYYVEGIATGTLEDRDEQRMSKSVIEEFAQSLPLPLTDSHEQAGKVMRDLGEVISGTILDDENSSFWIKARLDMDNPATAYMVKKIQKGKRYAFSIEGLIPEGGVVKTWSERLNKWIDEFIKVIPTAISVTTEPSYIPSFLDVVAKAYRQKQNSITKSNISINNEEMEEKEITTETTTVTPEVVETETLEATPEVVVETVESAETTEEAPAEESHEEVETVQKSADMSEVAKMCDKVEKMYGEMTKMVESIREISGIKKSFEDLTLVVKSMHQEMETIKGLPLQRKAIVQKSFEQRLEDSKALEPKTKEEALRSVASKLLNN